MTPGIYRVTSGDLVGALVRYFFTNPSGNADCRFAENFGPYRAGEIVVLPADALLPAGPEGKP